MSFALKTWQLWVVAIGAWIKPTESSQRRIERQQTTWKQFLLSHWECLDAIDFTTIEVWITADWWPTTCCS